MEFMEKIDLNEIVSVSELENKIKVLMRSLCKDMKDKVFLTVEDILIANGFEIETVDLGDKKIRCHINTCSTGQKALPGKIEIDYTLCNFEKENCLSVILSLMFLEKDPNIMDGFFLSKNYRNSHNFNFLYNRHYLWGYVSEYILCLLFETNLIKL